MIDFKKKVSIWGVRPQSKDDHWIRLESISLSGVIEGEDIILPRKVFSDEMIAKEENVYKSQPGTFIVIDFYLKDRDKSPAVEFLRVFHIVLPSGFLTPITSSSYPGNIAMRTESLEKVRSLFCCTFRDRVLTAMRIQNRLNNQIMQRLSLSDPSYDQITTLILTQRRQWDEWESELIEDTTTKNRR